MQLREYQIESKVLIKQLFTQGKKKVILCKPTGAGKTVTFASIALDTVKNGRSVAVIVDRKELIDQAYKKLKAYGLDPERIQGRKSVDYSESCFVSTVQTLIRRPPRMKVDLLIIDEAHKQSFDRLLIRPEYEKCFVIGATATPIRKGKMRQLSDLYSAMVEPVTIEELIADGFLVPAVTYAPKGASLQGVKTKLGDYDIKGMFNAFNKAPLYKGVVDNYKKFAMGDRAICFNVNVEHSKNTAAAFNEAGISARHLDGSAKTKVREATLEAWRQGKFEVLCNCDLFTTGFDEPTIKTVIVNRATQSVPLWLQMCGRGSRVVDGKHDFKIIDMGNNSGRLGLWEQPREFSLTHKKKSKSGAAPVKECDPINKGCGAINHASARVCKHCGNPFPIKKASLVVAEFTRQKSKRDLLPEELREKPFDKMSLKELLLVMNTLGYRMGWLLRQVKERDDIKIDDIRKAKGYKPQWTYYTKQRLKEDESEKNKKAVHPS